MESLLMIKYFSPPSNFQRQDLTLRLMWSRTSSFHSRTKYVNPLPVQIMPSPTHLPPPIDASAPHQPTTATSPQIYTYHCLCSTLLLTTPYALSLLPTRATPSGDDARILPLPPLSLGQENPTPTPEIISQVDDHKQHILPSLLSNTRPARKAIVVQRDDGWEKRRVWRCGRCALGWGYEIENAEGEEGKGKEKAVRVMYILDGGLVETETMMQGREAG